MIADIVITGTCIGHSSILDSISCKYHYIKHYYFIYMYYRYTDTVTYDTIIFYACPTDTRIHYFTG